MDKNIVVLGAQGFVGGFLLPALKGVPGFSVFAPEIEIRNFDQVKSTLQEIAKIDTLILLAGISSPAEAKKDQTKLYQVNVGGVINVVKALQDTHPKAHLIFTSTAQIYAVDNPENILSEKSLAKPQNEYALSKLLAEDVIVRMGSLHSQFSASVLRVFNHTHLSQTGSLFVPSIVRQLKEAKALGLKQASLKIGNIEIIRDFSPVQNLVNSIHALIANSELAAGVDFYNISSGKGIKLRDLIVSIGKNFGLEVDLTVDKSLVRDNEPKIIIGDNKKILAVLSKHNIPVKNDLELIYA